MCGNELSVRVLESYVSTPILGIQRDHCDCRRGLAENTPDDRNVAFGSTSCHQDSCCFRAGGTGCQHIIHQQQLLVLYSFQAADFERIPLVRESVQD